MKSEGWLLFSLCNSADRTNVSAGTAFNAHVRIDLVYVTCRNSTYCTFIDTSAACSAVF